MKIKNKTRLRELLLEKKDSVGMWDKVWFFADGEWAVYSIGTICPDAIYVATVGDLIYSQQTPNETTNHAITKAFRTIEQGGIL